MLYLLLVYLPVFMNIYIFVIERAVIVFSDNAMLCTCMSEWVHGFWRECVCSRSAKTDRKKMIYFGFSDHRTEGNDHFSWCCGRFCQLWGLIPHVDTFNLVFTLAGRMTDGTGSWWSSFQSMTILQWRHCHRTLFLNVAGLGLMIKWYIVMYYIVGMQNVLLCILILMCKRLLSWGDLNQAM